MKASEFRGFPGGLATGVLLSMIASLLWSTNPEPTTLRGPPPAPVCNPREAVKPSKFNEYLKARGNVTANCDLGSLSLSGCPPIHKRKPEISVCHVCERRHHAIRINKIPEGVVEVGADGRWLIVVQRLLFTDPKCQMKTAYVEHRRDAVVVEVGAYHGEELVQFRGRVSRVYSYEPHPDKIPIIKETARVESMAAVTIVKNAAVSNVSGMVTLYLPQGGESQQDMLGELNLKPEQSMKSVQVPAVRLDDEIEGKPAQVKSCVREAFSDACAVTPFAEHVDILKIDTQGHEFHVLLGAHGLIRDYGVDMIHLEFSPNLMRLNGADPVSMLQWLYDAGYVCFYCTEPFTAGILPQWNTDASWNYTAFTNAFGPFYINNQDHGMWGDMICI